MFSAKRTAVTEIAFTECTTRRHCALHFQAKESHRHPVYFRQSLPAHGEWIRQRIVSFPYGMKRSFADEPGTSVPVSADNVNGPFPAARFSVRDTKPIWAYC